MRMTRGLLALALTMTLAASCLALPATAFGQSAGDEQYVDPFQGNDNPGGGGNDNSTSNSGDQTQDQSTTTTTTTAPAETGSADTAGAAESDSQSLPRTGLPLAGFLLGGAALVGGGAALRRRA
jgi:hypothetical protein